MAVTAEQMAALNHNDHLYTNWPMVTNARFENSDSNYYM